MFNFTNAPLHLTTKFSYSIPPKKMASSNRFCVQCKTSSAWRIQLRGAEAEDVCGHVVCVNCVLLHIRDGIDKDNARIKCLSEDCRQRIHENDIRALLDPANSDLDLFMPKEERKLLLHRHDSTLVEYAFGAGKTRICPRCRTMYAEKLGCTFVRCPNLRCNTWFCWDCGARDITWAHFAGRNCDVGFDDIINGLYFLRFILTAGGCVLFMISVPMFFLLFILFPLWVAFAAPYFMISWIQQKKWWFYNDGDSQVDGDDDEGRRNSRIKHILHCALYVLAYNILWPTCGSILGLLSLTISIVLSLFYTAILFLKWSPIPIGLIIRMLLLLQCFTSCFGYGNWLDIYIDAREKEDQERRADQQFRAAGSERLDNPDVGR